MTHFSKIKTLLLVASIFLLFSCSEDSFEEEVFNKNSENIQTEFKTVSLEEAKNYFKNNFDKSNYFQSKEGQRIKIEPIWEYAKTSETIYNNSIATEVPVKTNFNGAYEAHLIFIKTEKDEIEGILTTLYPLEYNNKKTYNGYILNFDLDANYLSGYQYQNGYIIKELLIEESNTKNKKTANRCNDIFTQNWNENNPPFAQIPCPIPLSPVVVTAPMGGGVPNQGTIPFPVSGSPATPSIPPHYGIPNHSEYIVVDSPDHPIIDIKKELKCFDQSKAATITIYADQPNPNNPKIDFDPFGDGVGHSFITIKQGSKQLSFGFYPKKNVWVSYSFKRNYGI